MRPIHWCDLDIATRVVLAAAKSDRADVAVHLVQTAEIADRYRKRLGKAHPKFGTGTLTSAASGKPRAASSHCDVSYRACLSEVLAALTHQPA